MSEVTAEKVKELRERTGVGMGKCKEALTHAAGNMEAAIDFLRKSGMASAVKKEGRETKEGLIGCAESQTAVCLVEVNAETDFVTHNDRFKQFLQDICFEAAETHPASLESFLEQKYRKDPTLTIDQYRALVVQSLGEHLKIKRLLLIPKDKSHSIGHYSHMQGKIVTLVELKGGSGHEMIARELAMHVAAEAPEYLKPEEVPADIKAREEDIARGQVVGKPAAIIDKIVEGKIRAFYDQSCLECQKFLKDNSVTVTGFLAQESKRLGASLHIAQFIRWKVGE